MSEKVKAKKIVEKIKDSDLDDSIKSFLVDIFKLELPNIDKQRWEYVEDYRDVIEKYIKKPEEGL